MSAYVTDTHALVHYVKDERRKLGRRAWAAFESLRDGRAALYVPAPVSIEIWFLFLGGRLGAPSLQSFWRDHPELQHVELLHEDIVRASDLEWEHRDPYDRLIVSTALRLGLPLITGDQEITGWGGVDVCW